MAFLDPLVRRSERRRGWIERNSLKRFRAIEPYVMGESVLDVGSAEGWVGHYASARLGVAVQLLDVVDLNETGLPLQCYDGVSIPFADKTYDTVTILLTLHHCEDPDKVLAEARRIARKRVIVTESVYSNLFGKWLLRLMDGGFNRLRSGGQMAPALNLRTVEQWRQAFREQGYAVAKEQWLSRYLHAQRLFVLDLVVRPLD